MEMMLPCSHMLLTKKEEKAHVVPWNTFECKLIPLIGGGRSHVTALVVIPNISILHGIHQRIAIKLKEITLINDLSRHLNILQTIYYSVAFTGRYWGVGGRDLKSICSFIHPHEAYESVHSSFTQLHQQRTRDGWMDETCV